MDAITVEGPPDNVEHILKIAAIIKNSTEENKEEFFQDRFKVFKTKYPQMYKKVCTEPDFDMNNLQFMLGMLNQIQTKQKETFDAEAMIGQMLYDKYVKPKVEGDPQP
jgi:hypothetical protein